MAAEAGRQAVKEAGISPEDIDMIITATATPDQIFPCAACEVQKELGAVRAVCFDMNAACSGFLFAYQTAQAYISSGIYKSFFTGIFEKKAGNLSISVSCRAAFGTAA